MVREFPLRSWKTLRTISLENLTKRIVRDLDHPKEVLTTCPEQISQDLMNKAIDQWLDRILLVIRAIGGHIEHRLQ